MKTNNAINPFCHFESRLCGVRNLASRCYPNGRFGQRNLAFILLFLICTISLTAQNLQVNPSVQPVNGGTVRVGNFVVDWTLGQPAQSVLRSGNLMITQGFEQPERPQKPIAPSPQTLCSDTTVTFTYTHLTGAGADQLEWSLDSAFSYSTIIHADSLLRIKVSIGSTDTIWLRSRVSGNKLVSTAVYTILKVNFKPEAPTAPAPLTVNSDTAHTFKFVNLRPGYGGNLLEWTLDSSFATSWLMTCYDTTIGGKDTSSCNITFTVSPQSNTLFWLRGIDTLTGCISDARASIAIVTHVYQRKPITVDSVISICAGTTANIKIPGSTHTARYALFTDTGTTASALGNDTTLVLNTGNVYTNTFFTLLVTDTVTGDTAMPASILVTALSPVDTNVYIEGDTLVYTGDTAYYHASAMNGIKAIYSIISGSAVIDSLAGFVTNISSSFTIQAAMSGMPGCGVATGNLHVGITNIAAPLAPTPITVYIDSLAQSVNITFASISSGGGGNQIEWATNSVFSGSTVVSTVTHPASISLTLNGVCDSIIWIRSRNSTSGKTSKAVKTGARASLPVLSAGLLDKSNWDYNIDISDEFNYAATAPGSPAMVYPDEYHITDNTNFHRKWWLLAADQTGYADYSGTNTNYYRSNWGDPSNQVYDWGSAPDNPNRCNPPKPGCGHEVGFSKDGYVVITANKISNTPINLHAFEWNGSDLYRDIYYQSGNLTSKQPISMVNGMWEMRAILPPWQGLPHPRVSFWNFTGRGDFTIIDEGHGTSTFNAIGDDDINPGRCGINVTKQTYCDYSEDWHTYTAISTNTEIIFFIDGKETWSTTFSPATHLGERWPSDIYEGSTEVAPILIGLPIMIFPREKPFDYNTGWQSTEMKVDYFRYYTPKNSSIQVPQTLQNRTRTGTAQTLERLYNDQIPPYNLSDNNCNALAFANHGGNSHSIKPETKIACSNEPGLQKIYYCGTDSKCYNAYMDGGLWYEYPLIDWVNDVRGGITVDKDRVYYVSTDHELKFFQWVNTIPNQWINYGTGVYCSDNGHLTVDQLGRVWLVGLDNNVYAWCPNGIGGTTGVTVTVVSDNSVEDDLMVHSCGCLIFARQKNTDHIRQYSHWGGWRDNGLIPTNHSGPYALAIDEQNSRIYFAGENMYQYTWDYNQVISSKLKPLGYKICGNNACTFFHLDASVQDPEGTIAISSAHNMIFYKTIDNHIWYYYNDADPVTTRQNWYKTPVNYSFNSTGYFATELSGNERLFCVGNDSKLYMIDWQNADNPITCPTSQDPLPYINSYKTDENQPSDRNNSEQQTEKQDSSYNINVSVFPNPSKESFTFSIGNLHEPDEAEIIVEDINGRRIMRMTRLLREKQSNDFNWIAENVSGGIYYYRIKLKNGTIYTGKLMKL